jgi:hypothetical protein
MGTKTDKRYLCYCHKINQPRGLCSVINTDQKFWSSLLFGWCKLLPVFCNKGLYENCTSVVLMNMNLSFPVTVNCMFCLVGRPVVYPHPGNWSHWHGHFYNSSGLLHSQLLRKMVSETSDMFCIHVTRFIVEWNQPSQYSSLILMWAIPFCRYQ